MSNLHTAFLKCQPDEHGKALVNTATQYYSHTRLHHFLVCLRCPPCSKVPSAKRMHRQQLLHMLHCEVKHTCKA